MTEQMRLLPGLEPNDVFDEAEAACRWGERPPAAPNDPSGDPLFDLDAAGGLWSSCTWRAGVLT